MAGSGQQCKGREYWSFIMNDQGRLFIRCLLIRGFQEERAHGCGGGGSTLAERKVM